MNRRQFVATAAAGTTASVLFPYVATAKKTGTKPIIVGEGDHTYEAHHDWAKLPDKYQWQTTHDVSVDSEGLVYIIHQGNHKYPDHPAIFVFDAEGNFVRAFGSKFQGGGHGIEVRKEGNEEFLYVCAYQDIKTVNKLTLDGKEIWEMLAPKESGLYHKGEFAKKRTGIRNRERFAPTNTAFLDDGSFFVADGYGTFYIHKYDRDAKWLTMFGGPSSEKKEEGKFNTPHGMWIDNRPEGEPQIVIADRANGRLQWFTQDFKHLKTLDGFILPANVDVQGDLLLVPDLAHRITLLDKENNIVAQLGNDPQWIKKADEDKAMRAKPNAWEEGCFVHPHDACFDSKGNILVAEWVATGRISMLRKVGA